MVKQIARFQRAVFSIASFSFTGYTFLVSGANIWGG